MSLPDQSSGNGFTGSTSFGSSRQAHRPRSGNIVKNIQCDPAVYPEIDRLLPSSGEPKVIVHRNGDSVESIEFLCSCGCSKTVRFRYEGE